VRGSKQVFDAAIAVPDKARRGERRRSPEGVVWMDTGTLLLLEGVLKEGGRRRENTRIRRTAQ